MRNRSVALLCLFVSACALPVLAASLPQDSTEMRSRAGKLFADQNYAEALTIYRQLALDASNESAELPNDLAQAVACLQQTGQIAEFDDLLNQVLEIHPENWRLLVRSAELLQNSGVEKWGFLIAGKFERGSHRGGGQWSNVAERDRVLAVQLLLRALPLMAADTTATADNRADAWYLLANAIGAARHGEAWKLQQLTDLTVLPDPDSSQGGPYMWGRPWGSSDKGAPVDAEGKPVFHQVPESWEAASSDGERWRWALSQVVRASESRISQCDLDRAQFLMSQFGVRDSVVGPAPLVRIGQAATDAPQTTTWNAHELDDTETIARLATGVTRLTLPDEFNHIRILQAIVARNDKSKRQAMDTLVSVRMNRHQYPRAAALLTEILAEASDDNDRKNIQTRIDQIIGNWARIESSATQPAGTGASFELRFRNGNRVTFQAREINIDRLLTDVRDYLTSAPPQLDHQKLQIDDIGFRLLHGDEQRYLSPPVADWTVDLRPPENHFDAVQTIASPLQKAGAWWITGRMDDGNEIRIVLWVADTAITRKRVEAGTLNYVADAVTGEPLPRVDLEFFGWRQERIDRTRNYRVRTSRFADRTDGNGLCTPAGSSLNPQFSWLAIARTADGRLAFDGFNGIWTGEKISPLSYSPVKVYSITDRPVYRPGHLVKFRLWVRQPRFDDDAARFADQDFIVEVRNPKGDLVEERTVHSDRWGGLDGEYPVPADATLGMFQLRVCEPKPGKPEERGVLGTGQFRVEEYRKPEYAVAVESPTRPVMLGESFTATVRATYYFGAPVAEGTVHYKVERSKKDSRWYPVASWDWLYGPGYWWFAPEYSWYPGWSQWGCRAPIPPWWGWQPDPPEVVAEGDAPLAADGTIQIPIDTTNALNQHSDSDHEYSITAEVVDQSRRTIIGTGQVLVARDPFRIFVWTNRGHYRTGDTATVGIQARSAAGAGVAAKGRMILNALTYDGDTPTETALQTWDIQTDDSGHATELITLPQSGQFRITVELTDSDGHIQEGGYVVFVRGPNEDGRDFRFNDLELITERQDYRPGDSAALQISTNRINSTVLLFVRAENGLCPAPQIVRLEGKTTTVDIPITHSDMPNIFVEAITIADGRMHSAVREIIVPPEKRVANVEVVPSSQRYRPGDTASVRLKLTDLNGQPFHGNTVLSVYDASLEYIAASAIPEIRSFFWNVRRNHHVNSQCTLNRTTQPSYRDNEVPMQPLFGNDPSMMVRGYAGGGFGGGGVMFGGDGMMRARGMAAPAAAAMELSEGAAPADAFMAADKSAGPGGAAPAEVPATVRSSFADTAYWVASVDSDVDGLVDVRFKVPDNLTTWKIKAWALGDGSRVGSGSSDVISSKDLIIRPQTPRFFTELDRITVSAVVHNYLETAKVTRVVLESEGGQLELPSNAEQTVTIPAGGEVRVDWNVAVVASGPTKIRMSALTDEESDATEYSVPVQVHGILKTESFTGLIRPADNSASVRLSVPARRIEELSRLEVHYSPTLAGAMVDALPYLLDYPYGCTEQTLNRFLPAVLTQRTLQRMGINLADVQKKRTNLNAQQLGDPAQRAAQWKHYDRNPVFDEVEMNRIVADGIRALTDMQLSDGGWGWFSGYGEHSSAHLTSQVVHGLTLAQKNDVPVLPDVIARGVAWLKMWQATELALLREGDWRREHPDQLKDRHRPYRDSASSLDAFVAAALIEHDAGDPAIADYLYRDRENLSVYAKALTGLVLHAMQRMDDRNMILRNIEQVLVQDEENRTAWLRMDGGAWWYWYSSENEAMATYLKLLLLARPEDPTAPRLVKYLLNNRRNGSRWNSTRDTAAVVESLAEYIRVTGEDQPDMTIEVLVDGRVQKTVHVNAENLFSFDNALVIAGDAVTTGDHHVEIRRTGKGPVYFSAWLTNFSREDLITATGLEVKVQRNYFRLERDDREVNVQGDRGQVVSQQTARYKRIPIPSLGAVTSGDLVEVELILESKNDYEYLLLEDRKPSGFEPDDQRSGYFREGLRAYRELRDDRVSFFLETLARGRHSISYRLRAETPGEHIAALPAGIEGMYAPELVANSDEIHLRVADRPSTE